MKSMFAKIRHNHLLLMVLCCAIPLLGIMVLSFFGIIGSWSYYALMLLCPLSHFFMMRGMKHTDSHEIKQPAKSQEIGPLP